jgi:hypothetical protein
VFVDDSRRTIADDIPLLGGGQFFDSFSRAVPAPFLVLLLVPSLCFDPGRAVFPVDLFVPDTPCAVHIATLQNPTEMCGEPLSIGSTIVGGLIDGIFGKAEVTGGSLQDSFCRTDLWSSHRRIRLSAVPTLGEAPGQ